MTFKPPLQAIIIDDEPAARDDLRRLLATHREIAIVGEAGRIALAEEMLRTVDYDLVLLDVELRAAPASTCSRTCDPKRGSFS